MSSRLLRSEVGARSLLRARDTPHEVTYGPIPSVVFAGDEDTHGNFMPAAYRRILADPAWAARLTKTYTGSQRLPRAGDRWRGELECAVSSDALLMNVFCYPGVLRRRAVCARLGIEPGERPSFGVRAGLAMRGGEVDRTEFDMEVGELWVEAKLTEAGFGRASPERLGRYTGVLEVFDTDLLPLGAAHFLGYQLIRGLVAAVEHQRRYLVLMDERRTDLTEVCFRVLRAVRTAEALSRFRVLTWQELAGALPRSLQGFLADKYGIRSRGSRGLLMEDAV